VNDQFIPNPLMGLNDLRMPDPGTTWARSNCLDEAVYFSAALAIAGLTAAIPGVGEVMAAIAADLGVGWIHACFK
jgi:hypothetical protein